MDTETILEDETTIIDHTNDEMRNIDVSIITDSRQYMSYSLFCSQLKDKNHKFSLLIRETELVAKDHFKAYEDGVITSLHCRDAITSTVSAASEYVFKKRGKHYSSFVTACAVLYLYDREYSQKVKIEHANREN